MLQLLTKSINFIQKTKNLKFVKLFNLTILSHIHANCRGYVSPISIPPPPPNLNGDYAGYGWIMNVLYEPV